MILDDKLLYNWSNPYHTYGSCLVLNNTKLAYVNIPRNASTWTKFQLSTLGCRNDNYFQNAELVDVPKLIILREPIERWISGISLYMNIFHSQLIEQCEQDDSIRAIVLSMITNQIEFDAHTMPQTKFIQGIDFDQVTFIKVQHNNNVYREVFSNFFKNELGIDNSFDQAESQNVSIGNENQNRWANFFRSAMSSDLEEKLRTHYWRDFKLFNTVKFYDPK